MFVPVDEESGSEEETLQYFSTIDPNCRSRRKKKLDSQNKNSQSFLSVLLNINHGLMAVFTDVKVRFTNPVIVLFFLQMYLLLPLDKCTVVPMCGLQWAELLPGPVGDQHLPSSSNKGRSPSQLTTLPVVAPARFSNGTDSAPGVRGVEGC